MQQDYGARPKPGNAPNPAEVRMTKQIVILGNQLTRLEKIVSTQAVKTDNFFKLMTSKPATLKQANHSVAYWIAGGVALLLVLFVVFLLSVGIAIAVYKKIRG